MNRRPEAVEWSLFMKALVYEGPNKLNYTDVPDVSPAKEEVKLRIRA